MRLDKLGKKLRREITANPKKAIFLGLATGVAVYFWAPLVRGWMGNDQATASAQDGAAVAVVQAVASVPATEAAGAAPQRPSWQQVVQWMGNDPRTTTAPPLVKTRDPFELPKTEVVKTKGEDGPGPHRLAVTPTAAGLVLNSTIIGPRRRVAQISGKTYAEGQTIHVAPEKEAIRATFQVVEVHPRRVVLQAGGQRFELAVPEPGKSGKIEFLGK